ncbi:hypothetical protein HQ520_08535 [bacterium]|nr:hypothetical protein [bacterium]
MRNSKLFGVLAVLVLTLWSGAMAEDRPPPFLDPARYFSNVYVQSTFSSHDDGNLITDAAYKHGLHVFQVLGRDVDIYLKTRFLVDTNADFWNNVGEFGVGMQVRPFEEYGLILLHELLYGVYTREDGGDPNYWAYRAGFAFWQRWGRQPWEIEKTEFFWPLTGWHEVYADGFYYNRDDANLIGNLSWREGLILGKVFGRNYDVYLAAQAGLDSNVDFWNNYVQGGPGIRFSPFQSLDLNISFEYFLGRYYRGDLDGGSQDYADFGVTLAFYHEF